MKIRSNRSYRSFSTNQFQTSPLKQTCEKQTKMIKSQGKNKAKKLKNFYIFKQKPQVDRIEIAGKNISPSYCLWKILQKMFKIVNQINNIFLA